MDFKLPQPVILTPSVVIAPDCNGEAACSCGSANGAGSGGDCCCGSENGAGQ